MRRKKRKSEHVGVSIADEEEYANAFARAFLMPEKVFCEKIFRGYSVTRIAVMFGVEPRRVRERIEELDLERYVGRPSSWWHRVRWAVHRRMSRVKRAKLRHITHE